jgi:hypothetical protein
MKGRWRMNKKKEPLYQLTVKGLLCADLAEDIALKVMDTIELHLRRHYNKDGNGCIVLTDKGLEFGTVTREKK